MPPREWKLYIEDILEAISKIQRYTEGMDLKAFRASDITVDAVQRNLTIIGEAARQVPPKIVEGYPDIPWNKMRGLRNVVVHQYSECENCGSREYKGHEPEVIEIKPPPPKRYQAGMYQCDSCGARVALAEDTDDLPECDFCAGGKLKPLD